MQEMFDAQGDGCDAGEAALRIVQSTADGENPVTGDAALDGRADENTAGGIVTMVNEKGAISGVEPRLRRVDRGEQAIALAVIDDDGIGQAKNLGLLLQQRLQAFLCGLVLIPHALGQVVQYQFRLTNDALAVAVQGLRQVEVGDVQLVQRTLTGKPDLPSRQQRQGQADEHQQDGSEPNTALHGETQSPTTWVLKKAWAREEPQARPFLC